MSNTRMPCRVDTKTWNASEGQLADSPLISTNSIRPVVLDSVRGYYESQVLGDDGVTGTIELQTPNLIHEGIREGWKWPGSLRRWRSSTEPACACVNLARTDIQLCAVQRRHRRAVRRLVTIDGYLDLAWPFHANGDIEAGEERVHFRLAYEF